MENMEKKAGGMAAVEVEVSQRMAKRARWIDVQTYWYLMQLLELGTDEAEEALPWDEELLREVFEGTEAVLNRHGYKVCDPYIARPEFGRQYRCTLSECGCGKCSCQDEFMEKERLISNMEDAAAMAGLKIIGGSTDSVIVKADSMDKDFEIRVTQLAG